MAKCYCYDDVLQNSTAKLAMSGNKKKISLIPAEYSQEILGVGCPLAEHGKSNAAPADTEVFCARHTHVGTSG